MQVRGDVHEVFLSFQGEGVHVGELQVFVRTGGCSLRCRFCDTPEALVPGATALCRLPGGACREAPNPVSSELVAEWVTLLDPGGRAGVSLTGGEPLEQVEFLLDLVPRLGSRPVHLETAGVHASEMALLRPLVHTVALDLKLDSVAREGDRREEHRRFLKAAGGGARFAKMVVGPAVSPDEVEEMARLLAGEDPRIPLVLQPETPRDGTSPALPLALLTELHRRARRHLEDVRVIPQTHRFLDLP
jgi:organic radical activating enzyme